MWTGPFLRGMHARRKDGAVTHRSHPAIRDHAGTNGPCQPGPARLMKSDDLCSANFFMCDVVY